MPQKLPANYPITGVCIVSDPQKCPPGYDIVCIVLWIFLLNCCDCAVSLLALLTSSLFAEFIVLCKLLIRDDRVIYMSSRVWLLFLSCTIH